MVLEEFIDKLKTRDDFISVNVEYKEGWEVFVDMKHTQILIEDHNKVDYEKVLSDLNAVEGMIKWLI
jgi:hypothetical protein